MKNKPKTKKKKMGTKENEQPQKLHPLNLAAEFVDQSSRYSQKTSSVLSMFPVVINHGGHGEHGGDDQRVTSVVSPTSFG